MATLFDLQRQKEASEHFWLELHSWNVPCSDCFLWFLLADSSSLTAFPTPSAWHHPGRESSPCTHSWLLGIPSSASVCFLVLPCKDWWVHFNKVLSRLFDTSLIFQEVPNTSAPAERQAIGAAWLRDRGAGKKQQCHFWGKAETCPTISDVLVVRDRVKMMKWKVYKGELQPLFAALCFTAQPLRLGLKPWHSHHSRAAFSTPFILKHSKETNERGTAFAEKATESQLCQTSLPRLPGLFEPRRRGNKT